MFTSKGGHRHDHLQWNVYGLTTYLVDVRNLVEKDKDIDVLLEQETKLHPSESDPSLPAAIRRDRPSGGAYWEWPYDFCQKGHLWLMHTQGMESTVLKFWL